MKKIIFIFILSFYAVSAFSATGDTIRVLAIGNSFSVDAIENFNLYDLGKADNVVFIIGNMYIPGCSLEMHWENATDDLPAYSYQKIDADRIKTSRKSTKLSEAIVDEKWDYITFQQASRDSGKKQSYFPYLQNLLDYTKSLATNPGVKYAMHMTWAYAQNSTHSGFRQYGNDQMTMFNAIVDANIRSAQQVGIELIIPAGTAVQNGRTSYLGDTFCRDGHHLDTLVGRYTVACAWYEKLSGNQVAGNTYIPAGISDRDGLIAQKSAGYAVNQPYSVTNIGEDTGYSASGKSSGISAYIAINRLKIKGLDEDIQYTYRIIGINGRIFQSGMLNDNREIDISSLYASCYIAGIRNMHYFTEKNIPFIRN